jgi:hypothetical protein
MSNENTNATEAAVSSNNVVTMKDGRQVDFGKRGKQKAIVTISGEGAERQVLVSFDIPNGDTHSITVGLTHPLVMELVGYGIKQKIADSLTAAEDADDISLAVERAISNLNEGKWTQRSSEGASIRGFADLFQAYCEVKGVPEEDVEKRGQLKKSLLSQSEEIIKTLRNHPSIKAIMARIASEKAAARSAKLAGEAASQAPELLDL